MKSSIIKHVIGLSAAAFTTLVLFSAVVSIADDDKAEALAAHIKPSTVAKAGIEASP